MHEFHTHILKHVHYIFMYIQSSTKLLKDERYILKNYLYQNNIQTAHPIQKDVFSYNVKFSWQCNCVPICRIHVNAFITDNNMVTYNYKSIAIGYKLVSVHKNAPLNGFATRNVKIQKTGFQFVYWLRFSVKDNEQHHVIKTT